MGSEMCIRDRRITKEILEYIQYAKAKGCSMTGPEDPDIEHINILTQEVG